MSLVVKIGKLKNSGGDGAAMAMLLMAGLVIVMLFALYFVARFCFKLVLYIIGSTARVKTVAVLFAVLAAYGLYRLVTSDKWEWVKTLLLDGS